jgi:hypothetical protein
MSTEEEAVFTVLFSFIPVLFWKGMLKVIVGCCFISQIIAEYSFRKSPDC